MTLGAGGPDSHRTANLQANSLNLRAALVAWLTRLVLKGPSKERRSYGVRELH